MGRGRKVNGDTKYLGRLGSYSFSGSVRGTVEGAIVGGGKVYGVENDSRDAGL